MDSRTAAIVSVFASLCLTSSAIKDFKYTADGFRVTLHDPDDLKEESRNEADGGSYDKSAAIKDFKYTDDGFRVTLHDPDDLEKESGNEAEDGSDGGSDDGSAAIKDFKYTEDDNLDEESGNDADDGLDGGPDDGSDDGSVDGSDDGANNGTKDCSDDTRIKAAEEEYADCDNKADKLKRLSKKAEDNKANPPPRKLRVGGEELHEIMAQAVRNAKRRVVTDEI